MKKWVSNEIKNLGVKQYFSIIILLILITDLSILLNMPFLRQIFGFLFLTLLPGLLILMVLRLNKIDFLEKFILAWGLSISFLMLFGLLINNLSLSLSYETPLSTIFLLISFNIAFVILGILGYKINNNPIFSLPSLELSTSEKAFLIVPVFFPALSIFGMHVMNTTDNNVILMFLLFLIPIYVISVCLLNQKFPKRLYPVVIFLISMSLVLLLSLRSNYIIGMDIHLEYIFFRTTLNKLHWSIFKDSLLDASLAISLLPTIYQSILKIAPVYLYKILYSLIYSISPLVIYVISKKYIEEGYAFLASCFFMFQFNFLFTEYNPRTCIAVLFFALAMMVLFSDKLNPLKKRILFIVFMASCMVSHYSTTYIFFFILFGSFLVMELILQAKRYTFKKIVSLTIVILFFSMIFFWYSQVTEVAFNAGVSFIENTLSTLNEFFVEESRGRGATTQSVLGKDIVTKGIPHKIEFVFTWLTFAFIGIGIITLIIRYKEMSFPELKLKKPEFLKEKFEVTYFVIALACVGLLIAAITLPFLSGGYSLDRSYAVAITILSVFFVIGGIIVAKYLNKTLAVLQGKASTNFSFKKKTLLKKQKEMRTQSEVQAYLIILLVLIPYFLCVTGVMYNIFGVPRAIILNSEGEQYDPLYIHDHCIIAREWESSSDVVEGRLVNKQKTIGNMTAYLDRFEEQSRIYDNGGSEVWG